MTTMTQTTVKQEHVNPDQGRGALVPEWTLGDRLRKVRRMCGLGQAEFAVELGTNQKTYASWEADKSAPRHAQLIEIAKKIESDTGISASWVLGVESPPPPVESEPDLHSVMGASREPSHETTTPCAENVVHGRFPTRFAETAVPQRAA